MKIKTILTIATIVSLLFGVFSNIQSMKHKAESQRLGNNLHEKTIQYEDEKGRLISEKTILQVTNKELKNVLKKDTAKFDEYDKTIYNIAKELSHSNRKVKHLETALTFELETNLNITSRVKDTIFMHMKAKTATFSQNSNLAKTAT